MVSTPRATGIVVADKLIEPADAPSTLPADPRQVREAMRSSNDPTNQGMISKSRSQRSRHLASTHS
jgi:hypothetical protein